MRSSQAVMAIGGNTHACESARARAALLPDGELSLLELRALRAHLSRCPSCAQFAADIDAITTSIRSAPLDQPAGGMAVVVRRRRAVARRIPVGRLSSQLATVAAGAVLAVTVGSWSAHQPAEGPITVRPIVIDESSLATIDSEPAELRIYRRTALIGQTPAAPRVGKHPGTQPL